jgi:hypothetical protein
VAPQRALWLAIAALCPVALHAQAWLPPRGSVSASILYTDIFDTKHYLPNGGEIDVGHMRSQSIFMMASFSPSDRVLLTVGVPYVRSEYHGAFPHPTPVDNGDYHGTFTDLHIELRYQVALEPVAFAASLALVQPTHNYPSLGHAAPGRNLWERWVGFFVGKSLDLWIPRTYVQARYSFAFVQPVADVGHDRSNLDFEVGHFVTEEWSLRGLLFWQRTHGGIDVPIPPSNPLYPHHDQLAAESFFNVGIGTSVQASKKINVFLLYTTSLQGTNGHKLGRGMSLGLDYSFTPHAGH